MKIPELKKKNYSSGFYKYLEQQRAEVVIAYLFKGLTHRKIDSEILGWREIDTHGYETMHILHYLGITRKFRGKFAKLSVEQGIDELKALNDPEYDAIIDILKLV